MKSDKPERDNSMILGSPERNWPEDFEHENGNYVNKCGGCGEYFKGHKRRVRCKLCDSSQDMSTDTQDTERCFHCGKTRDEHVKLLMNTLTFYFCDTYMSRTTYFPRKSKSQPPKQ